jgi:uncharacterized protein (DUF1800 family)
MDVTGSFAEFGVGALRGGVVGVLCVLLAGQPLLAAGAPVKKTAPVEPTAQIQGEERVLHALNRLTFGPRPGEVQAVEAMGLQKWFEQQMNPQSIDDSALEQRLEMFPAMKMQQAELMQRYPSPQLIRQMIQNKEPLPSDPTERAIYQDQIALYKIQQAKKQADDASKAASAKANPNGAAAMDGMSMEVDPAAANMAGGDASMASSTAANAGSGSGAGTGSGAQVKGGKKGVDLLGIGAANPKKKTNNDDSMATNAGKAALPGDGVDPSTPAMTTHEEQFYSGLEAVKIINLPPDERVKRILAMKPQELIDFRKSLSAQELAALNDGLSPLQRETILSLQGSPRIVGAEVLQSRLLRDIYSERQLEAVMTDFWLNHFNVYIRKNQNEPYLLPAYERDVIRPNALGNFEDLLVAVAKSPAMLVYLDNSQSIGPDSQAAKGGQQRAAAMPGNPMTRGPRFGPMPAAPRPPNPPANKAKDRGLNENYARELMELHTLGVQCEVSADRPVSEQPKACGQGYTQKDVTEVAKVLTGWTIDRPLRGGEYQFEPRRHEPGAKTVLGRTIEQSGEQEGLQVLHMLASSPATAEFVSRKLAVRFVSDNPPQSLVDRMAKSFETTHGDIKAVLRTMFNAPEFWSPEVYRAKVKTPLEFVVSAVRASDAEVVNAQPLVQSLERLGMPLYGMQTPNGYNWTAEPWVNTADLVNRMNFALVLSGNRLGGTRTDWPQVLGSQSSNPTNGMKAKPVDMDGSGSGSDAAALKEQGLEAVLLGQPASVRTRETVLRQFDDASAQQQAVKDFSIKAQDPELMAGTLPGGSMAANPNRPRALAVDQQAAVMAGLLLGSPEFQRR